MNIFLTTLNAGHNTYTSPKRMMDLNEEGETITTAKPRNSLDIPNALTKVSKVLFQASLHLFL